MKNALTAVLIAFVLGVQLLILKYVHNLEKIGCECATGDWRRNYIMVYLALTILLGAVNLFLLVSAGPKAVIVPPAAIVVLGWLYIVFTLQYVDRLRREKCECSQSVVRDVMEAVALINALMLVLSLVLFLVLGAVSLAMGSRGRVK
jgi:hypothetical protein